MHWTIDRLQVNSAGGSTVEWSQTEYLMLVRGIMLGAGHYIRYQCPEVDRRRL